MSKIRPVTAPERARMRQMREQRMSIGVIALEVDRTEQCVWSHVKDMPIRVPHGPKAWPDTKVDRFLTAYGRGIPADELGPAYGLSPGSVKPTACKLRRKLREARA